MINREDLLFATCYQLAEMIRDDWDEIPAEADRALMLMRPIDEPDDTFIGGGVEETSELSLKCYEIEPEALTKLKKIRSLHVVIGLLKKVMKHSDGWNTQNSDSFKKEINLRLDNYTDEIKRLTTPEPARCHIRD